MEKSGLDPDQRFLKFLKENKIMPQDFEIHQLLAEFIFRSEISLFNRIILGVFNPTYPIQELPFSYGLKITNIGSKSFAGGDIKNFILTQQLPRQAYLNPKKEISIPLLAPQQSAEVWCGRLVSHFQGPVTIECNISPINQNHAIETFQKIRGSDMLESCENQPGNWIWHSYIERRSDLLQKNITLILMLIALINLFKIEIDLGATWNVLTDFFK